MSIPSTIPFNFKVIQEVKWDMRTPKWVRIGEELEVSFKEVEKKVRIK